MKKLIVCILLALTLCAPAYAEQADESAVLQTVQNLLVEEYAYTQAEVLTFTYDISDMNDTWAVFCSKRADWMYWINIDEDDLSISRDQSPFVSLYASQASEYSVRYMLHAIDDNDWFDMWNAQSRAALAETIEQCGDIQMNASLQSGLASEDYTPAQALDDLFFSCYGEESLWSEEISTWRDAAFEDFGLIREGTTFALPEGITSRCGMMRNRKDQTTIYEFVGAVPDALADVFADPNLQGWTCLAGTYHENEPLYSNDAYAGTGLAAFANGDDRLLVMLLLDAKTKVWQVVPISQTALLPDRELYITYNSNKDRYSIRYPVSSTEEESFQCKLVQASLLDSDTVMICRLLEYCDTDLANQTTLVIDSGDNTQYSGWYRVTVTKDGTEEQTQYLTLAPSLLEYVDIAAFPRTEEACRAAAQASAVIPEGYGISGNVHLREKTSSHSKDLGMYRQGTLVQVLDTQPGTSFPWYHVRVGTTEGYMSSNYVDYDENLKSVAVYIVPCMAKLKDNTALKQQAGIAAKTIENLPANTIVRVLAVSGNWLHVSVVNSTDDWLMQPDETCGYIKSNAVHTGVTALQLDWLWPDNKKAADSSGMLIFHNDSRVSIASPKN